MVEKKAHTNNSQVGSVNVIPGYKITDVLGRGGMAIVYLAIQESIGRSVALKVLAPNQLDETFTERFLREAKIVSRLSHPNIVTIYDAGVHNGQHYMSMEFIPGKTLREARNTLSRLEKVDIIKQVAQALDYAGNKGYVHRDIKPDNIMQHEDGRAILTDFGIARGDDTKQALTLTGKAIGTPYYMSPEQTKGTKVDPRSDLYSLGVVLYQALSGHVPFDGPSFVAIGIKHISEPIPPLPKGMEVFQPIINKAMSKDPQHRYQSGAEFLAALANISEAEIKNIDGYTASAKKNNIDYNAATVAEADVAKIIRPSKQAQHTKHKQSLPINSTPEFVAAAKRKLNPIYVDKITASNVSPLQPIDITSSEDFKILKRRRSLLLLLLLSCLLAVAAYNKNSLRSYWFANIDPFLQQNLPLQIKHYLPQNPSLQETIVAEKKPIALQNNSNKVQIDRQQQIAAEDQFADSLTNIQIVRQQSPEIQRLFAGLPQQPENAIKIASVLKSQLDSAELKATARSGLNQLRRWYAKNIKAAIADNDIHRGRLLLNMLTESFPRLAKNKVFLRMQQGLTQRESIQTHLTLAQEYFNKQVYSELDGESALQELQAVLQLDPNNSTAKELARKLVDHYVEQAKREQAKMNYTQALLAVESGLQVLKNDILLISLQKNLQSQILKQKEINILLLQARQQFEIGNYISPENKNAHKVYLTILKLEPSNKKALQGLHEIENKLIHQINTAINNYNIEQAKSMLKSLESYFPQNAELKKTRIKLATAIDATLPKVIRILISDNRINSLNQVQEKQLYAKRILHIGFKYINFNNKTTPLQINLLGSQGRQLIASKRIRISGENGDHFLEIALPGKGLPASTYHLDVLMGSKSLIRKSFEVINISVND